MAENYEGDAIGFPSEVELETEETPSPNFVVTLNSLAGAPRLVDEDGNDLPTDDVLGTITVSGAGAGAVRVNGSDVLISPTAAELVAANPEIGGSSSSGNSVFVDKDGSDSTGTRERFDKPFLTLAAGVAAMIAGDTLYVRPGVYAETLAPKEQAWNILSVSRAANIVTVVTNEEHGLAVGNAIIHFLIDAGFTPANTFDGEFVVNSIVSAFSYTVRQYGATESSSAGGGIGAAYFYYHFSPGAIVLPASGAAAIDMYQGAFGGYGAAVISGDGLFVSTNYVTVLANINALYLRGQALRVRNTDGTAAACLGVAGFVKLNVDMTESIISEGYDAILGNLEVGTYIRAPLIMGGVGAAGASANAIEVNAPVASGTAVIEAGRIVSLAGAAIQIAGGNAVTFAGRLIIRAGSVEGKSAGVSEASTLGTQQVDIHADWITANTGPAIDDAGTTTNTIRVHGARVESTYNHANGFAARKTGSAATLVLDNCTLVPHATSNVSISSGGAVRTVTCHGSKTAYALGAAVVAPGLLVDSTVK